MNKELFFKLMEVALQDPQRVLKAFKKETLEESKPEKPDRPSRLTADKLKELRLMTPRQIAAIYKYGKVHTIIDDDPAAFKELRWMTQGQLEALFGKEDE